MHAIFSSFFSCYSDTKTATIRHLMSGHPVLVLRKRVNYAIHTSDTHRPVDGNKQMVDITEYQPKTHTQHWPLEKKKTKSDRMSECRHRVTAHDHQNKCLKTYKRLMHMCVQLCPLWTIWMRFEHNMRMFLYAHKYFCKSSFFFLS